jgi:glycine/D-amino acid oxidase-like deaminating enzyme
LHKVVAAGGAVLGRNPVTGIRRENSVQFIVTSREGVTKARNIVVATNGYTPRQFGWHARRIVPFTGYMAATQSLPPEVLTRLLPRGRTVIDTNMNIDFFRPAPDGSRLLFGGATGSGARDTATIAMKLHARLIRVYPELVDTKFSHIWTGRCAGTFDMMPHIGRRDGVWFGMGYNFAGVPMASYFGEKIANQILGHPEGRTIFEQAPFRTIPFYNGNPWFVPYLMRLFAWQDRRKAARP